MTNGSLLEDVKDVEATLHDLYEFRSANMSINDWAQVKNQELFI